MRTLRTFKNINIVLLSQILTFYSLGFVLEKKKNKHLMSFCVMLDIIHAGTIQKMVFHIAYKQRSSLLGM